MRGLRVMGVVRRVGGHVDHRLSQSGRRRDTGAVATIVVILLGWGVLLGVAALTIDTGALFYERSQLQNGADAAALAVAKKCLDADKAGGLCSAADVSASMAVLVDLVPNNLAGANAADHTARIASVCGSAALVAANPSAFTLCPAPSTALVECPNTTSAAKYVEVRTETLNEDGSTILPPIFAQTLSGAGDKYSHTTVKACARAGWGSAGSGPTAFPVTFSYCDWQAKSGANPLATPSVLGTYEAPPQGAYPGYGNIAPNTAWPAAGKQVTFYTAGHGSPASCPTWNGHVAPGNFGTLNNSGCNASVVDGWVQGNTGNSRPCNTSALSSLRGTVVYIAIFDCDTTTKGSFANCTNAHGSGDWYHISGYAAFYVTGFYFSGSGSDGNSIFPQDNGHKPCSGSDRCVSGWFTTDTLQTTIDTSGAPGFGSWASQLLG